jgi:tetratricopeptide (TPR) repeat protein
MIDQPSSVNSGFEKDVVALVSSAHSERTQQRAVQLLNSALQLCEKWLLEADETDAIIWTGNVLTDLALEDATSEGRSRRWHRALHILKSSTTKHQSTRLACAFAFLSVDCAQDLLSSIDHNTRAQMLRDARECLDVQLEKVSDTTENAALLARKSSVLRQLAMFDLVPEQQYRRFDESLRCATKAVQLSRNEGTLLELGLSEWALGSHENTDSKYSELLRRAEGHLADNLLIGSEVAQLSLARLFRLTFRPLEACKQFSKLVGVVRNYRRVLRDSYIYAEAAIQLWYRPYPDSIISSHLVSARSLIEHALASGIRTGRHVVDLCQLGAILDGPAAGTTVLQEIFTGEGYVSWEDVLRLIGRGSDENTPDSGFILGVNDGSVWTSLGTFFYKFFNDKELAERLYRYAIRLDPKDPVALTNLARFQIRDGKPPASLQEARRLIQKVAAFADRRFIWWRAVDSELKAKEGKEQQPKVGRPVLNTNAQMKPPTSLKDITRRFHQLVVAENPQQRGLELEQLLFETAKLSVGIAEAPYRFQRSEGRSSQVDGYFRHGPDRYRVECKWERDPIAPEHIDLFANKIDAAGVGGLFISLSGFTESAIRAASQYRERKAMLLMDGDEARSVFEGRVNFDEIITMKRAWFDQYSESYHRCVGLDM